MFAFLMAFPLTSLACMVTQFALLFTYTHGSDLDGVLSSLLETVPLIWLHDMYVYIVRVHGHVYVRIQNVHDLCTVSALVQVAATTGALVQVAAIISALVQLGCYHWCSSTVRLLTLVL